MPPVVAFLTTAFVGVGFSVAVAGSIAAGIVNFGINTAVSLGVSAIFGKKVNTAAKGITVSFREAAASHRLIYGRRRVGGVLAYAQTSNKKRHMHLVVALAGHECDAIEELYFNEELVWNGSWQGDWADVAELTFHAGSDTQTYDTVLAGRVSNWTSNHRLRGVCYLYIRLIYSRKAFQNGLPNISAVVRGKKCYDPRTATTIWTQNPAVCLRDYLKSTIHGASALDAELDDTSIIAAANLCDETSDGIPRYQINGVIDTENTLGAVITDMAAAMMGTCVWQGGKFRLRGGAYVAATGPVLMQADFVGPVQIVTERGRRNSFNAVKGTFISISDRYAEADYPQVTSSTYLTEDGEPLVLDFPQPFETSSKRAQRNAKIALRRSRQRISATVVCKMTALVFTPGDTVRITMSRYGWSSKEFEVTGVEIGLVGAMTMTLSLRETASSVYSWTNGEDGTYTAADSVDLPLDYTRLVGGRGSSLNDDPDTVDLAAWTGTGISIVTDTATPSGLTALSCAATSAVLSLPFDVNPAKNYTISVFVKQISGTSTMTLVAGFLDSADAATVPSGWPGSDATYAKFGLLGVTGPASYTEYRISFGPNETAQIPSGAKTMVIGLLANTTGGAGVQRITEARVVEKAQRDLLINGAASDKLQVIDLGPYTRVNTATTMATLTLGAWAGDAVFKYGVSFEGRGHTTFTITWELDYREKVLGGSYGSWINLWSWSAVGGSAWDIKRASGTFTGAFDDSQVRFRMLDGGGTGGINVLQNLYITYIRVAK